MTRILSMIGTGIERALYGNCQSLAEAEKALAVANISLEDLKKSIPIRTGTKA